MTNQNNRARFAARSPVVALIAGSAPPAARSIACAIPSHEDCRAILINYIRAENVGIDVGFWFMEDARYTTELIKRFKAGVPVRVIMDLRANATNPCNAQRLAELQDRRHPDAHAARRAASCTTR